MIWILMFVGSIAASIFGIIYMTKSISRFSAIKNNIISFILIIAVFIFFAFKLTWMNALLITIYTTLFFLLFGLLGFIIEKLSKHSFRVYWQGWLALFSSIIFLGTGYYLCFSVVETDYQLTTNKDLGALKIALITDSHIGTTFDGEGFAAHIKTISLQNPDLLIISGDYVDDDTKRVDMEKACEALGDTNFKYGVWFAYGNHDKGYFDSRDFSAADLENALIKNGVHILEDEYELVDNLFYIVGRADKNTTPNRASIQELLSDIDENKYIIVIDHEPADYDAEAASAADLVLCGHTHGGQMIPITHFGVLSGIDDSTYGLETHNDTNFIVSSGISDWALYFKTGTRSEYVIIDINGN